MIKESKALTGKQRHNLLVLRLEKKYKKKIKNFRVGRI